MEIDEKHILIGQILVNRKDFKIGYLFDYNGKWHAVKDGGDLEFICLRLNGNKLEGVVPHQEPDRQAFFEAVNNNAYKLDGTHIEYN